MLYNTVVTLIAIFFFFKSRSKKLKDMSLERKMRALEGANLLLAKQLNDAERELTYLQQNTVPKSRYKSLERECDLLTKHIEQHLENI